MKFLIEVNNSIYEISELVRSISYTDKLNDGCSKLEFSYIDDNLKIQNGAIVHFIYEEIKFFGVVFKHNQNKKKEVIVTAYDQLRYAKAKDTFSSKNDTITTLVKKMCNHFGLVSGDLTDTSYILKTNIYENQTWLDILYGGISETLTNKGKWYCLRDEYRSVAIRDLEELYVPLILGDESLAYDFNYEKSIDENFYNLIRIQDKKNARFIEAKDKASINKYGLLQYFEIADEKMNPSQIKSKANMLLSLYNRETESLPLNCLGDSRIRAGSSFFGQIEDINLNKRLIVRSVTHNFLPIHTMQIEVAI